MNDREVILIRQTVVSTLQMLGVGSGFLSYNKGSKIFGKPFREMVRRGEIRPVSVGDGKNGTQTYAISDILKLMA